MLEFRVKGQELIRLDNSKLATDSEQYLKAKFIFDDTDWNGKVKTGLFHRKDEEPYKAILDANNICIVPAEVLVRSENKYARTQGSKIFISVIGEYSTVRITTNEIQVDLDTSGYCEALEPSDPTESEYQQLVTQYAHAQASVEEAKEECEVARDDLKGVGNLFANGIKGNLSGAVVFADDVSPIEHEMIIGVHGKNLFDVSKIQVQGSTDNIYISAVGEGYIDITTKEAYDGNGHCVTFIKLKELCPQMKVGKQYALSATTTAWNKMIYLKEMNLFWSYGTRQVVTEEMLECTIGFYGFNSLREQGVGVCRISNIQCEEGYDITGYEPYINPSTVKVRRCGKNIYQVTAKTQTTNGLTFTVNDDGSVTVNGTASKTTFFSTGNLNVIPDETYFLSGSPSGSAFDTYMLYIHNNTTGSDIYDLGQGNDFVGTEGDQGLVIVIYSGVNVNNLKFYPMVEYSSEGGTFEAYNGEEFTPSSDGTVEGITSLSPNMTIMTDTEGVVVECEYIKDTNKVIKKISDALNIEI